MAALAWAAVSTLVLFIPSWLFQARVLGYTASLGTLAAVASALLGRSAGTPATPEQSARGGWAGLLRRYALALAAPVAIVFLLVLLVLGTDWLLDRGPWLESRVKGFLNDEPGARRHGR